MEKIIPYSVVQRTCKEFVSEVFSGEKSKVYNDAAEAMLKAIVTTGTPLLHTMAKHLSDGKTMLKGVQERLSGWLANYDFAKRTRAFLLAQSIPYLRSGTIVAIDSSDISKEFGGKGMEGMAMGFDASRKVTAMGHDIVSAAIVDGQRAIPVAVEMIKGRKGKNRKAKAVCRLIMRLARAIKPLFVFDRGFDSEEFVNWVIDSGIAAVVRMKEMTRDVFGSKRSIEAVMSETSQSVPCTLHGPNRKIGATVKWKVGYWPKGGKKNRREQCEYRPVLIVSSTFDGTTLYFICTGVKDFSRMDDALLQKHACSAAQAYFRRWSIEVFFQDVKTAFGLEQARVRTFKRLKNLLAFCVLGYEYIRRTLMGCGKAADQVNKLLKDNFGQVMSKFRTFVTNLRELLAMPTPRCITGRPKKKPPDNNLLFQF